ncbi:MAG: hypothetical protein HETSPECPRED_010250 [Heterodermia speciosa]|uniref:Uncharacterized protein n=1 Tax=Heterodermia speciosa TaxID=116794 RepID=A0A8H3ESP7_9LECA|nr:MAG: hypothetical protein HETSPECPRED_010250 [Heterodermia speciosa]
MDNVVDAAWPHKARGICYEQDPSTGQPRFPILEVSFAQDSTSPKVQVVKRTLQELSDHPQHSTLYRLRLLVISRSWRSAGTNHEKLPYYDISKENFAKALNLLSLTTFYSQTRADVTGLFKLSSSHLDRTSTPPSEYFALIYDAFLGFWARYDSVLQQWHGICTIAETSLDLKSVADKISNYAQAKELMYLFAAQYTVDFLGVKSGELPAKLSEIEKHSGHHDSILRPVPATYKKLEETSAHATATANLVSYFQCVVSSLGTELLQFIETSSKENESQSYNIKQYTKYLRQRLKSLTAYLRYLDQRAARQVAAIFHLVAQANASINLAVAQDTKTIAAASKHDSSSIKMLAAVTTVFLPGAFTSSLFSMSMFNWLGTDGSPVVSERLWIYWSITIPLTVVTLGIWLGWDVWTARQRRKHRPTSTLWGLP